MNLSAKQWLLVGILLLLALVRFVVVPLIEWQDQKVSDIERIDRQLTKGEELLAREAELSQRLTTMQNTQRQFNQQLLFEAENTTALQLSLQRKLDEWFSELDIEVRNSNWLTPIEYDFAAEHRVELSVSGNVEQVMRLMLTIEQHQPKISIVEASGLVSSMRPKAGQLGVINGRIVLSVFQKLGESA